MTDLKTKTFAIIPVGNGVAWKEAGFGDSTSLHFIERSDGSAYVTACFTYREQHYHGLIEKMESTAGNGLASMVTLAVTNPDKILDVTYAAFLELPLAERAALQVAEERLNWRG